MVEIDLIGIENYKYKYIRDLKCGEFFFSSNAGLGKFLLMCAGEYSDKLNIIPPVHQIVVFNPYSLADKSTMVEIRTINDDVEIGGYIPLRVNIEALFEVTPETTKIVRVSKVRDNQFYLYKDFSGIFIPIIKGIENNRLGEFISLKSGTSFNIPDREETALIPVSLKIKVFKR